MDEIVGGKKARLEAHLGVVWNRGEKHEIFWYSGYGQMDFDPKIFSKPEKVKIEEAKQ